METKKTNGMDKEAEQKEPFGLPGRFSPLFFLDGRKVREGGKWEAGGKKWETTKTNGMDKEARQKVPFGLSGRFPPLSFVGGEKGIERDEWDSGGCLKDPICLPSLSNSQKFVFFVSNSVRWGVRA